MLKEITEEEIFIREELWQEFNDKKMEEFIDKVFYYYRNIRGFPHFDYDINKNRKKFKKLKEYDTLKLIDGKNIKQTMHGLDIAWSYFPHVWEVRQGNCLTPMEVFEDDEMLRGAIKRRIKLGDAMSDNMMRKILCIYRNAKRVSNFRPTAASCIYEIFGGGVVYDMSAGFGGRLLGAMSNPCVSKYIGVDPETRTFNGLCNLIDDLGDLFYGEVEINHIGSEDFIPNEDIDIAFTSPPYFDTEKYSDEATQSYIKFPSYDLWINEYVYDTLQNCYFVLKNGGKLIINITNTKDYRTLEKDFNKKALEVGFKYNDTYSLLLSKVSKNKGYKKEPIFVFTKEV